MLKIRFSKEYRKLHGQTSAKLIAVERHYINMNLPVTWGDLIEYDTTAVDGTRYELKTGHYLLLVFLGNKLIPFTTIRSDKPAMNGLKSKYEYYSEKIGQDFVIVRSWEENEDGND